MDTESNQGGSRKDTKRRQSKYKKGGDTKPSRQLKPSSGKNKGNEVRLLYEKERGKKPRVTIQHCTNRWSRLLLVFSTR